MLRPKRITIRLTEDEYQALQELRSRHGGTTQGVISDALNIAYNLHDHAESIRQARQDQPPFVFWQGPDTWSGKLDPDEEYERELMRHEFS